MFLDLLDVWLLSKLSAHSVLITTNTCVQPFMFPTVVLHSETGGTKYQILHNVTLEAFSFSGQSRVSCVPFCMPAGMLACSDGFGKIKMMIFLKC